MSKEQQEIDTRMIADYSSISRQIKASVVRLQNLRVTTDKWNDQFKGSIQNLIGLDFIHLLDSIDYIEQSCKSLYSSSTGVGNHFIPYTTFYREILSTIKQVMMKVHYLMKNQLQLNKGLSIRYNNINELLKKEFQWRNRLEHDIDPFFEDYEEVLRVVRIDKMLTFMEMIIGLLGNLDGSQVDDVLLTHSPDYNKQSLLQRKRLIHENNETFLSIVAMLTELSYLVMQKRPEEELKILLNLVMKCGEISKFIQYTYSIDSAQFENKERVYAYFARLGLTFCYQFYDKLGLYLKQRYSLATKTTYFKENVRIVKDSMHYLQLDEILLRCINIEESKEYHVLNTLRQAICHKNKWVDYKESSEVVSTLIVRLFTNMTELAYLLINDYFVKYQLQVSTNAMDETLQRTKRIKM